VPGLEPFDRQSGLRLFFRTAAAASVSVAVVRSAHRHLVHVPLDPQRRRFAGHFAVELHRLARVPRNVVQLPHEMHDACSDTKKQKTRKILVNNM